MQCNIYLNFCKTLIHPNLLKTGNIDQKMLVLVVCICWLDSKEKRKQILHCFAVNLFYFSMLHLWGSLKRWTWLFLNFIFAKGRYFLIVCKIHWIQSIAKIAIKINIKHWCGISKYSNMVWNLIRPLGRNGLIQSQSEMSVSKTCSAKVC